MTAAQHRILVAEDDDDARVMLQRYLEGKGHEVVAVADGQAAVDALAAAGGFDLVLLDVMMPRLSGFDVLTAVRGAGDTTPIIMATAAASSADVVRALSSGADDYVTKPFAFPVLLARIELRLRLRPPPPAPVAPPLPREDALDASDAVEGSADRDDDRGILARLRRVAERFKQSVARAPVQELVPGTLLGERYLVGERIGFGGFGVVVRARHVDLGQDVAIKVLHAGAKGGVDEFRREAQNACRVRHPNAVRVFDFGTLPGSAYLVMELLEGPTLEELVAKEGALPIDRAAATVRAVLSALGAAHRQHLVHRDVKPQNIVIHSEDGRREVKLLDFGIAKMLDDMGDSGNVIMGSAAYVPPERLRGDPYDGRADVYACGVILYRMLTGRFPFDIALDDFEQLALWHLHAPRPAPSWRNPALSPAVDRVVQAMLDKDPRKRPDADEAAALVEGMVRPLTRQS